jgi:hypothetical protein
MSWLEDAKGMLQSAFGMRSPLDHDQAEFTTAQSPPSPNELMMQTGREYQLLQDLEHTARRHGYRPNGLDI